MSDTIQIPPAIAALTEELVAIRRDIHAHPEIGFEEVRTAAIVAAKLRSLGIEVHEGVGKTGVVGVLTAGSGGNRRIGLRADMDALPLNEETGLDFSSTIPGKFHGCGHDVHTTILLGAAQYLAESRNFDGTVVFVFQPAEEGLGGARAMLADGVFERFPVDEIFGLHNSSFQPHGVLHVSPGTSMAGADFFDIEIKGRGGHAAAPENSRDPLLAAAALTQALQQIISRNVAANDAAVVSVTELHAGSAYNIIADRAQLRGTVRALSDKVRAVIGERIRAIAAGIALAHDVEIEVKLRDVFSTLTNSDEQLEAVAEVGRAVLGEANVSTEPRRVLGSEDFADFLRVVPGAFFTVGHHGTVPLHNPKFVVDEGIIPIGVTLFGRLVEARLPVVTR